MSSVEVLRVFCDESGAFGNPLGVVLDGGAVPEEQRQPLATELGYSETVFVDDVATARVRIFTPGTEIPFAGHPMVGTAWLLARHTDRQPSVLRPPAGEVPTWAEGEQVWVRGPLRGTPPWWHERLASAEEVAELRGRLAEDQDATQLWAWEDEPAGRVRARVFAERFAIREDEACGSASMRLAAALGRRLVIRHGEGSLVLARPGPPGTADVGGRVVTDGPRPLPW
jgi:predicted PhzF superfamily epimerase YddE/YHI9